MPRLLVVLALTALTAARLPATRAQEAAQASDVHVVPLAATGLIYDPVHKNILAEVGDSGTGDAANSITVIDATTGQIKKSVFAGTKQGAMTLSADNRYLYVAVHDGNAVRRLETLAMPTAGPLYVIPSKPVQALFPLVGRPEGFVALRGNPHQYNASLAVFLDGQIHGAEAGCGPSVALGIGPSRLFTFQDEVSSWDFDGYIVTPDGVTHVGHTQSLLSSYIGLVGSVNGLIVSGGGAEVDPEMQQKMGDLDFGAAVGSLAPFPSLRHGGAYLPDSQTGKIYCLLENGRAGQQIVSTDALTFQPNEPIAIPSGVEGSVGSPIRFGADGFAYIVGKSVVLFRLHPLASPAPVDLSITRSGIPATLPDNRELTYRLAVTNKGLQTATDISLTDALPPDCDVLTMKASQGSVSIANNILRAPLGTLTRGAKAIVDVTLRLRQVHDDSQIFAAVRSRQTDANPEDNIERATIPGAHPTPTSATPGAPATPPALPSLSGQWDDLTEDITGAGVNLQITVRGRFSVRNDSKKTTAPFKLRFYLAIGPFFNKIQSALLQQVVVPALKPNEKFVAALNAPLDAGEDITGFYVYALLDPEKTLNDPSSNTTVGKQLP